MVRLSHSVRLITNIRTGCIKSICKLGIVLRFCIIDLSIISINISCSFILSKLGNRRGGDSLLIGVEKQHVAALINTGPNLARKPRYKSSITFGSGFDSVSFKSGENV